MTDKNLREAASTMGKRGGRVTAKIPGHMSKAARARWKKYREQKAAEDRMTPQDRKLVEAFSGGIDLAKCGEVWAAAHSGL
jgi:phage terminase small subunit